MAATTAGCGVTTASLKRCQRAMWYVTCLHASPTSCSTAAQTLWLGRPSLRPSHESHSCPRVAVCVQLMGYKQCCVWTGFMCSWWCDNASLSTVTEIIIVWRLVWPGCGTEDRDVSDEPMRDSHWVMMLHQYLQLNWCDESYRLPSCCGWLVMR